MIAIANFVAFFMIAQAIGGDAVNGRAVDGRYYVSNHGRSTEVSQAVYTYSLWHVRSLFVTHPLAMLAAWMGWRNRSSR